MSNLEKPFIEAVQYNGLALEFIEAENQTYNICLAAVRQNRNASKFILILNISSKIIEELKND